MPFIFSNILYVKGTTLFFINIGDAAYLCACVCARICVRLCAHEAYATGHFYFLP